MLDTRYSIPHPPKRKVGIRNEEFGIPPAQPLTNVGNDSCVCRIEHRASSIEHLAGGGLRSVLVVSSGLKTRGLAQDLGRRCGGELPAEPLGSLTTESDQTIPVSAVVEEGGDG